MLTPSVNVVQSAFAEDQQGEISGLSRCISNLGSSLGTAIAGTILVSSLGKTSYAAAMIVLALIGIIGLGAARLLPRSARKHPQPPEPETASGRVAPQIRGYEALVVDVAPRAGPHNVAELEECDLLGDLEHVPRLLLHQKDGDAAVAELLEHRHHLGHDEWREAQRRLVGDQDLRRVHEHGSEGEHLLLTTREAAGRQLRRSARIVNRS